MLLRASSGSLGAEVVFVLGRPRETFSMPGNLEAVVPARKSSARCVKPQGAKTLHEPKCLATCAVGDSGVAQCERDACLFLVEQDRALHGEDDLAKTAAE